MNASQPHPTIPTDPPIHYPSPAPSTPSYSLHLSIHTTPQSSKPPLLQPDPHPLLPHRCQILHIRTRPDRLLRLQQDLILGPVLAHALVELEQLDARVLRHVFRPERRGSLQGGEPGGEGDGFDAGGAVVFGAVAEILGHSWYEGVPGAGVGVDEVVVLQG